jgi:TolB-like protein
MSLWSELRRRNVVRVAVAYLAAAWLLLEVASVVLPSFLAPVWIMQALIVAIVLGFPLAVLLAWHYEWTPEGIRTASDVPAAAAVRFTGRKLDFVIIGLLILAVAFLWIERDDEFAVAPNSIAVLPFANLSPDPDNAYYAAGLHDEIMNQLAKLSALSLVSRTSVLSYADTTLTIPEVARELGVANVIEGSVRFAGDRIRITMQLIDAGTDKHLWSETYDHEFRDIFEIESDIAMSVAQVLAAEFSEEERLALDERPFESPEAYKNYLRSFVASDLAAREAASLAIAADPGNLFAYTNRAYQGAMSFGNSDRPAARLGERQMEQMEASVLADVDYVLSRPADPRLHAMAYTARALLHTQFWRWTEAGADLDQAIDLIGSAPAPSTFHNLAWQLALIGRGGEGIGFGERAIQDWPDVRPDYAHMALGGAYLNSNRPAAAAEVLRKAVEINPDMAMSLSLLLVSELVLGEPLTSPETFEAYLASTEIPTQVALYAHATALHSDTEKARAAIARFEVLEQRGITGAIDQTFIALARRNREQAIEWMQRTIDRIEAQRPDPGGMFVALLSGNVMRDPVLDDPEFVALREQLRGR